MPPTTAALVPLVTVAPLSITATVPTAASGESTAPVTSPALGPVSLPEDVPIAFGFG